MTAPTSSDPLAAAHLVRRSLAEFARRMRSLRAAHGVSASKLSVLGRLHRAGRPLTASELAALERLQPQSLTRIIADLEDTGLIIRTRNDDDRRQIEITLSRAGRELVLRDAMRQSRWLAGAMAERLSPAERAILVLAAELLDRMGEHPDGSAAGDGGEVAAGTEPQSD